jgi:hypothetical protein
MNSALWEQIAWKRKFLPIVVHAEEGNLIYEETIMEEKGNCWCNRCEIKIKTFCQNLLFLKFQNKNASCGSFYWMSKILISVFIFC